METNENLEIIEIEETHRRRAKYAFLLFLLIACLAGAAYLGYMGVTEFRERKAGDAFYAQLSEQTDGQSEAQIVSAEPLRRASAKFRPTCVDIAEIERAASAEIPAPKTAVRPENQKNGESLRSEIDFASLQKSCPDAVGWLRIDGTAIDYPILHGEDNEFYLYHLPDGTPNVNGCIMMDRANTGTFSDEITILHGHHMRSGSMFGSLDDYKEKEYYLEHPAVRLFTPEGDYDVEVFAACTVNGHTFGYPTSFADQTEFDLFIRKAVSATPYETDVTVSFGDRMLMLSTCAYSYEGARFVVIGKVVKRDE